MNELIQLHYVDDGMYRFECGVCKEQMTFPFTLSWYTIGNTFPAKDFKIKHCWSCGVKFETVKLGEEMV